MATIEQVEKLREKANVTYDEAKAALEASNDDILDAMIYLERNGKVPPPENNGFYTSQKQEEKKPEQNSKSDYQTEHQMGQTFSRILGRIARGLARLISKGNVNSFEVWQKDKLLVSAPLTVLALLLIFAFWMIIPLLIVGLFFNCRYLFQGPDFQGSGVNDMMKSASEAAENIKNDFKGQN
ncbi:MAG: Elongation factor Ts, mitochondrial [Firmicutes bacterium ADurb.Bin193]|nr:MAG: Elongation factor Ts, mitochondrial [Firmicutes bacterium ADurb.Bin193]